MWVENPNPYNWKLNEVDVLGIPFVKKVPVVLQRGDKIKTFVTQEQVDAAWLEGWHDTKRPETAEVVWSDEPGIPSPDSSVPKPPTGLRRMTIQELLDFASELNKLGASLDLNEDMPKDEIREAVVSAYTRLGGK